MREPQFDTVAALIARSLRERSDETAQREVREQVAALCDEFNPYASFV
jgi:glycine/serine hydroxymethyltransferase